MMVDLPGLGAGRRERHKRAMWNRLYAAAVELFTEHGYDETSIDDIAEHADVARGTFFNYFDKKEDVITAWGDKRRSALRAELKEETVGGDRGIADCLENCMRKLAKINQSEWRTTRVMLPTWVRAGHPISEEPYLASLFAEIIVAGQQSGHISEAVDAAVAGNALREIYLGTLYRYVGSDTDPGSLDVDLIAAARILLFGLVRPDSSLRTSG